MVNDLPHFSPLFQYQKPGAGDALSSVLHATSALRVVVQRSTAPGREMTAETDYTGL